MEGIKEREKGGIEKKNWTARFRNRNFQLYIRGNIKLAKYRPVFFQDLQVPWDVKLEFFARQRLTTYVLIRRGECRFSDSLSTLAFPQGCQEFNWVSFLFCRSGQDAASAIFLIVVNFLLSLLLIFSLSLARSSRVERKAWQDYPRNFRRFYSRLPRRVAKLERGAWRNYVI